MNRRYQWSHVLLQKKCLASNGILDPRCHFKVKIGFSTKKKTTRTQKCATPTDVEPICNVPNVLTKLIILSQVNSIYDSLGLASPYTVRAKILMRKLWTYETKLDWDDPIPEEYGREWMTFFNDLPEMVKITVKRCIKPHKTIEDPILIIFSCGSNNAYGACAYVRWELSTREFVSYILLSKKRLAPVKKMSIDRIELCGAVLNKRLKTVLQQQCRYKFQRYYHIVDSQIVHACYDT